MTGGGITPAQLAQALALASGIGQPGRKPIQGVTGMGVSGGGQQTWPSHSQPSSASAGIPANMFQQAMQQALLSSSGGQGRPQQPDTAVTGGQQGEESGHPHAKVERMREMGIKTPRAWLSRRPDTVGGDLQAIVDLIIMVGQAETRPCPKMMK